MSYNLSPRIRGAVGTFSFLVLLSLLASGFGIWRYGSAKSAIMVMRGKSITIDAASQSVGKVETGMKLYRVFKLKNHSRQPIRIVGSSSSCTCVVPEELPITIEPGDEKGLQVLLTVPTANSKEPWFEQTIYLYTTAPGQPELTLHVSGEVVVNVAQAG